MGNLAALLSILVGGLGFVLWVAIVTVLGPVFLHRLLSTGALFFSQAAGSTGRQAVVAGKLAVDLARGGGVGGAMGMLGPGNGEGDRLTRASAGGSSVISGGAWMDQGPGERGSPAAATMEGAARRVDDSDGKDPREV